MPKPPKKVDHIDPEALPQGYDAGNASGTMDENKHIHDVKNKIPGSGSHPLKAPRMPAGPYDRDVNSDADPDPQFPPDDESKFG